MTKRQKGDFVCCLKKIINAYLIGELCPAHSTARGSPFLSCQLPSQSAPPAHHIFKNLKIAVTQYIKKTYYKF